MKERRKERKRKRRKKWKRLGCDCGVEKQRKSRVEDRTWKRWQKAMAESKIERGSGGKRQWKKGA
jgi:hypothetical protein